MSDPVIGPVIPLVKQELDNMKTLSREDLKQTSLYKIIRPFFRSVGLDSYFKIINRMIGLEPFANSQINLPDIVIERTKFDINKLFPSKPETYWSHLVATTDKDFDSAEGYGNIVENIEPLATQSEDVCIPETIKTVGVVAIATTALILFLSTYYYQLGFPPFLFARVSDVASDSANIGMLLNVFFQSRMYYIFTGKYLPIIVYDNMASRYTVRREINYCHHATMCVYLPSYHANSTISTWYRIFIDSSSASYVTCGDSLVKFNQWESAALQKYKMALFHGQLNTDIQINQIFCVGDVQKEYPTCAHWSTMLALMFVYNYDYLIDKLSRDPIYLTQWFVQLSETTDKHMEHFLKIFLRLRRIFYERFMYVLKFMDPEQEKEQEESNAEYIRNDSPQVGLFLKGVLFGVTDDSGFHSTSKDLSESEEKDQINDLIKEAKPLIAECINDMDHIISLKYTARREVEEDETKAMSEEKRHVSPVTQLPPLPESPVSSSIRKRKPSASRSPSSSRQSSDMVSKRHHARVKSPNFSPMDE